MTHYRNRESLLVAFARLIVCCIACVLFNFATNNFAIGQDRPNIILIMADDVGIEGLECYGGTSYATPNLNAIAEAGIRFTNAYSQPLCTPTRVQLMTGKYNHRNWRSFGILDPNARTFGHMLSEAGYRTGIFGKWQLQSYDPPDLPGAEKRRNTGMHPKDAGFDEYALFHALNTEDKGSRYANPTMLQGVAGQEGELKTYAGRYGEDVWVEQILSFFDRNAKDPKFVYYPMALPHWPFQPTPNSDGWDPSLPQPTDLSFAGDMIEYMDTTVGSLFSGLRERNLLEETIVIFYSDNGTHLLVDSELADGRTVSGGKATTRQTGIHVPLIAHCPARFTAGVNQRLVDASDFVPTLLQLAGLDLPKSENLDGLSFAGELVGAPGEQREMAFFWYDPRPGWDKERFRRSVFVLDTEYKYFQDGRLYRLTDHPLEELPVDPLNMTDRDLAASTKLREFLERTLNDQDTLPPLVDAYGNPEISLVEAPSKEKTAGVNQQILDGASVFEYAEHAAKDQRLWIFNPLDIQDDELRPCVVFFHGGGWGGSPNALAPQCAYLQRRGMNAVSVHFRAPRGNLTPADTLRDARQAYRWLVQNGKEHHIDVDNLFLSGGSAGGHLALALLTIGLDDDPVGEHLPKGLALFNPVIDLVEGWSGGQKKCVAAGILPESFSPAHHLRQGLPPLLIMSGSKDKLITPLHLSKFEERCKQNGIACKVTIYPGSNHGFFNFGRSKNTFFHQTMWQLEDFVRHTIDE